MVEERTSDTCDDQHRLNPGEQQHAPRLSGKALGSLALGLLSFGLAAFAGLPAIILGVLSLDDIKQSAGRLSGRRLAIAGIASGLFGATVCSFLLMLVALDAARTSADISGSASQSANNIKYLNLAMHAFAAHHGQLPAASVPGANGQPMTSWRILLLPYLELGGLYDQYDFNQPWDTPTNQRIAVPAPSVYRASLDSRSPPGDTSYVVVQGPGTAFVDAEALTQDDLQQYGASQRVLLVEMHESGIQWLEPRDLHIDQMSFTINDPSRPSIRSKSRRGAAVGMADGSVHWLVPDTTPSAVEALLLGRSAEALNLD